MGIKFNCPQGHKLNVKSFLAGKRGICPHCDTRFRIPMESGGTAEQIVKGERSQGGGDATRLTADMQDQPQPGPAASVPQTTYQDGVAQPEGNTFTENVGGNPQTAGYVSPASADPIAESPNAVWYVRPRSGGQFGPAAGDILREWINEGRVAGDSLVWCEGWPDWRQASSVFPQLAGAMSIPNPAPAGAVPNVGGSVPVNVAPSPTSVGAAAPATGAVPVNVSGGVPVGAAVPVGGSIQPVGAYPAGEPLGGVAGASPAPRQAVKRRKSGSSTAIIVVMLILVAVILAGVFAWILFGQPDSETAWQSSQQQANPVTVSTLKQT